jgi:hypothetical protein
MIDQKKIEQAAKEINPYTPGLHRTAFNEGFTAGVRFDESEIGQIAQEFALWVEKNCVAVSPRKWEKVIGYDSGCYTVEQLYKMFEAERNQNNGG